MKLYLSLTLLFYHSLSYAIIERSHPKGKDGALIKREGYSLQYDHECKIPHWVSYLMRESDLIKNVKRTNDFRPDPEIKDSQAALQDYKNSGYDRGHMARAGLFTKSKKLMSETFVLSNIVPQDSYMNQNGAWRRVEDFEYESIITFKEVLIASGPVTGDNMQRIGPGEVCVPNEVYKVMYKENPRPTAVAFIIPNYRTSGHFTTYAVSIDELEKVTGIDFLPELEDSLEKQVEGSFNLSEWR